MALLKQCFCYSLRQGSFIIGSYSLVVYCVAFAVELWWIVESLLILPAPAYTLCALYFFDFIMAAILLFGLLVRQRKYLMSWTLMTVLSFFPEAGMVLFMSLYYWPAHKFEYGVIELVYWSLRAIFNIFGAVCVCSLYLTWRDEELILGRLHDLTLANVETGSTGVGVLRSGNFAGTLKGNSNLAYQNYAYVESSPGLPDNLSYKNSNTFHSKCGYSPSSLCSFFTTIQHPSQPSSSSQPQSKKKHFYYYYYQHHNHFHRYRVDGAGSGCKGDGGILCQRHQQILVPFSSNCFHSKSEKAITSLPILSTEASCCCGGGGGASGCDPRQYSHHHTQPFLVKCGCKVKFGGGAGGNCRCGGAIRGDGRCKYLFCSIDHVCHHRQSRHCYYETLSQIPSTSQGPNNTPLSRSERDVTVENAVLTTIDSHQQRSEPLISTRCKFVDEVNYSSGNNLNCTFSALKPFKHQLAKRRQSCQSSSSESGEVSVPKIEIVICTEVHGSVETKVIRRPETHHQHNNSRSRAYRKNSKLINIPFSHFRRAVSDSPRVIIMEGVPRNPGTDDDSSIHTLPDGSMDSTSSIIVDASCVRKNNKKFCNKNGRNRKGGGGGGKCKNGVGGVGDGEDSRRRFKIFAYFSHVAKCCVSRSATSLLSPSCSGDLCEGGNISGGGGGAGVGSLSQRGLYNTRSFTMNSDVHQATLGNRGASLAMKSEFNPAMLFDPAYRKSRISELGIAGIGLEPPGQIPIGTFNRMNRSRSLWNVSNEDYWNRPPPSRPVSLGYVNHIHQMDQLAAHKDCCLSMNNNSNATMNLNKQMIMKGGFGGGGICSQGGYRNPIHGSITSVATSNHASAPTPGNMSVGGHHESCGIHRDPDHRRNWLASGRRAQSVDGLNHFYHRYYGRNIAAHHNLHPGGLLAGDRDHHSQDWSKSSLCPDEPSEDLRNYHDIAL